MPSTLAAKPREYKHDAQASVSPTRKKRPLADTLACASCLYWWLCHPFGAKVDGIGLTPVVSRTPAVASGEAATANEGTSTGTTCVGDTSWITAAAASRFTLHFVGCSAGSRPQLHAVAASPLKNTQFQKLDDHQRMSGFPTTLMASDARFFTGKAASVFFSRRASIVSYG